MKTCSRCGARIKGSAGFCKHCGAELSRSETALDQKKAHVLGEEKGWLKVAAMIAGAAFAVMSAWVLYHTYSGKSEEGSPKIAPAHAGAPSRTTYTRVRRVKGEVLLRIDDLNNGEARFYAYPFDGKEIKFFLIRASDGSVRAAFDACTACYPAKLGHRQKGDVVICNNCGMSFTSAEIGTITGGCSPIPIKTRIDGRTVAVEVRDLKTGAKYF